MPIRFIHLFLALLIFAISFQPVSTKAIDSLQGVVYGKEIFGINSKAQFDLSLNIHDLYVTNGGDIQLEATITYDGTSHEWKTSGKAYPSENLYLGGTVLAFEETPSFWVRSFKIEEDAKPALLLPANQDLAETTVIKAALIDKATGSLLYVEDEFRNSDIVAAIQAVSETPTRAEAISQEAYEHSLNVIWLADSWFYHYLPEPKRLPDHEARLIDQLVVGIEKLPTELQEPLNEIVVFFIEHLQENQRKDGRP